MGTRAENAAMERVAAGPGIPLRKLLGFVARLVLRRPLLLSAAVAASVGVALASIAAVAVVAALLASLAPATPSTLPFAPFADALRAMDTVAKLRVVGLLLVGIAIVRGACTYGESRMSAYLKILVERDLRERIFDDLLRVEFHAVQERRTADLQTLLHTYPRQSADIVDQYLAAFTKTVSLSLSILALLVISVPMTLLAAGLGGVSLLAVRGLNRAVKRNARVTNELRVRLQQTSLESIQGMKVIRLFGREDAAREKYSRDLREMRRQSFRGGNIAALIPPVLSVVNMALVAALILGASLLLPTRDGAGWVTTLGVFLVIMLTLVAPLQSFSKKRAKIISELPALEEVYRFLETPKRYVKEGSVPFERLRDAIEMRDVSYAYPGASAPTLKHVDLRIPRGTTTAIVGSSGSGKSTLLLLLARLADPTGGAVVVDGRDLREHDSTSWRRRIAFVSQDTYLFQDTVRNNIRFARPDATDDEVMHAARRARAHEFILALDQGYDTLVGERGARLSGGQAQRVAIARALLADPDLLVLDEATSALDTETERGVQEALDEAARGRTVVIVAHRLSTVRRADQVVVLEAGGIVERGTHDALLARRGRYWELAQLQDLGPASSSPPRRVPLAPRPARAVLTLDAAGAHVVLDDGERRLAKLASFNGEGPEEALSAQTGDLVLVSSGATRAVVRIDGRRHDDVALFLQLAGGKEVPTVVREISPGAGALVTRTPDAAPEPAR